MKNRKKRPVPWLCLMALILSLTFFSGIFAEANSTSPSQKTVLKKVSALAKEGKVLNADFTVKDTTSDKIEGAFGKPDSDEWISAAKGRYLVYMSRGLVFGVNKGEQIFEIRSFDHSLSAVAPETLTKVFGKAPHISKTDTQLLYGYYAGKEFRLEFVFKKTKEQKSYRFDHYNVLYPKGTVNMMADDKGRMW